MTRRKNDAPVLTRRAQVDLEARTVVFVYGTLLSGERNHRLLRRAHLLGERTTMPAFRLYSLGSFPGLVAGGDQAVRGELYAVDEPTLASLDALEDHPEFYRRTSVVLADGAPAETYLLTLEQVVGRPVIDSGDWRAYRTRTTR